MARIVRAIGGVRVLEIEPEGSTFRVSRDASDLLGDALGQQADMVLLPVSRLHAEFFELRTGIAGDFFQKFVNYGVRLAIVGDVPNHLAVSDSLQDLVREVNRGVQIWFVADIAELELRLSRS